METQSIEYKQSFNRASIETLVAFANAKGGTIYDNQYIADPPVTPLVTPPVTPPVDGTTLMLLSDLERQILSQIRSNSSVSRSELAKLLEVSVDTIKQYLRQLRQKGVIERIGGTSTAGRWVILVKINHV